MQALFPSASSRLSGRHQLHSLDPVDAIADICEKYDIWLHVDAAYAGPAATLPEKRGTVQGMGTCGFDRR